MEVKSKFNIGDTIYYMYGKCPTKDIIFGITFFVGRKQSAQGETHSTMGDNPLISYHAEGSTRSISELDAYATKEELQKSLFANL